MAQRRAGKLMDFQGSDDTAQVVGMQSRRCLGIDGGQALVQCPGAGCLSLSLQTLPHRGVHRRSVEQSEEQRLQVQRCAPDEKDAMPTRFDILAALCCTLQPPGHAGRLPGIQLVHQVMADAGTLRGAWLGGADVQAAVKGHRIHRHDFRAKGFG